MPIPARLLEPAIFERLRKLVVQGDYHAIRALRRLQDYQRAPAHSKTRRAHQRAFVRHADRALGTDR